VLLRCFHHPEHGLLVGVLIAGEQRAGVFPASCCLHINDRPVLSLSSPLPPIRVPDAALEAFQPGLLFRKPKLLA
jgi:hypothetical protein